MTNENNTENLNIYLRDLERKNANLEKELEKEQNEKIIVIQEKKKLETGFRIDGKNSWLWVFTSTMASYYKVAPTRGHTVP